MNLTSVKNIIAQQCDLKICVICGAPFKPYNSRQKTCGDPMCQKAQHNAYLRERNARLKAEDPEWYRKYHREAQRKSRQKQKAIRERAKQLEELHDRWKRQEELGKKISEYGDDYGSVQMAKTLANVPKIDVNLGGKTNDTVHGSDKSE